MKKLFTITLLFLATISYSQNHIIGLNHKVDISNNEYTKNINDIVSVNWTYKFIHLSALDIGMDLELGFINGQVNVYDFRDSVSSDVPNLNSILSIYASKTIGKFEPNIKLGYGLGSLEGDGISGVKASVGTYYKLYKFLHINAGVLFNETMYWSGLDIERIKTNSFHLNLGVAIKL